MPFYPGTPFVRIGSRGKVTFFDHLGNEIFEIDHPNDGGIYNNRITGSESGTSPGGILYINGRHGVYLSINQLDKFSLYDAASGNPLAYFTAIATQGLGMIPVLGLDNRSAVSANDGSPIVLYAVPSGTGKLFRITADIWETTAGSGTQTYTVIWTENGATKTMAVQLAAGLNAFATATDLINPDGGTNITGQLTGIAGGAVVKVSSVVEQIV